MRLIEIVRERFGEDRGFSLAETLVASVVLLIVLTVMFSTVFSSAQASKSTRVSNDSNEEARIMLTRMARELREATAVTDVTNPGATGTAVASCDTFDATQPVSITFQVDFDGDKTIEPDAADPEELTYTYDPTTRRVVESAAGQSYPVLAGNVEEFKLTYTSRNQLADGECDATAGGTVYWSDLDRDTADGIGNNNGVLDNELSDIDAVTIQLTMQPSGSAAQQTYRTQVDLRNAAA